MFVLIWATLLLSVRCSSADTGPFPGGKKHCQVDSFCISLSESIITAETGFCVVIPCSFTTKFSPKNLVWYKCEPSKKECDDSDIIFHTNKNNKKVQSGFKGRVSLLEPDVTQRNCSIIINDLTESDSGSYQLRVIGIDNFTFLHKTTVSIKGLTQKPTVMIPPLTEGQQTTLTCTAPGLCSGSDPEITWMWRGAGETDSHITGNITVLKTEDVTAVTQRHSSTLTFNPSAEDHGTDVTCKVSFANNILTEETKTLNVSFMGNTATEEMTTPTVTSPVQQCGPHSAVLPWAVAGVSLSVNVLCTVSMIFLWKARTKMTPNQEDRTHIPLQKTDRSPEYDVTCQPLDSGHVEAPLPSFSLYECMDALVVQEYEVMGQPLD